MNSREAREILAGYRPGVDDASDPKIAAALALAASDPDLAQWLERQHAVDAAVRAKLRGIPLPVGLETRILANRPAPRRAQTAWWRRPAWASAALAVMVVLGIRLWPHSRAERVSLSGFRSSLNSMVSTKYAPDFATADLEQARRFAAQNGYPAKYAVPRALQEYPLEGVCTRHWNGHRITLLCFGSGDGQKPEAWLLVIPRSALTDAPADTAPHFGKLGEKPAAWWSGGKYCYVVATTADDAALHALL